MDPRQAEDMGKDARFYATNLAVQIADRANARGIEESFPFAVLTATMILQNLVTLMILKVHAPASETGEAALREFYREAEKDTIQRWHKRDLKERGFGPKNKG